MRYALFTGCVVPVKFPQIESSFRKVADKLGVKLIDLDFTCCPDPTSIKLMNETAWTALAARNLCIAEREKLDIVTLCAGCSNTLVEVNHILRNNREKREEINRILSETGMEYEGSIEVKHFLSVLHDDVNLDKIKKRVKKPLDLKVAVHYGCHTIRPKEIMGIGERDFEDIVESIGCTYVEYPGRDDCCGSALGSVNMDSSLLIAKEKIVNIKRSGADMLSVLCPSCFNQFDLGQVMLSRKSKDGFDIPVFYLPQLLALSFDINRKYIGLEMHKVKTDKIIERVA